MPYRWNTYCQSATEKQFSPEQINGDSRYHQKQPIMWNGTALTYQGKKRNVTDS